MSNSENTLPHWDMSVVYPGLASAEFEAGFRCFQRVTGSGSRANAAFVWLGEYIEGKR